MRVTLMHNPSAGSEDHHAEELSHAIKHAGHDLVHVVSSQTELARALTAPPDLVAVAGGDGTFGKAAAVLAGTGIPFTLLALGTANNVARTLSQHGPVEAQIASWETGSIIALDAAWMTAGNATSRFFEAAGFGAFPRLIHREGDATRTTDPGEKLVNDLTLFRKHLSRARLRRYTVVADGKDLSGDYMLVEVMNIPFLGPQVPLAPSANPRDGRLDLVLAGEEEREILVRAIDRLRDGKDADFSIESRRFDRIEIVAERRRYHRDGELGATRIDYLNVRVDRGALKALVAPEEAVA